MKIRSWRKRWRGMETRGKMSFEKEVMSMDLIL